MKVFFEPRSVVLIGVTRQTGPGAFNNLEMLRRYGYSGKIFLVHPQVQEILGQKTFPRVADLPEPPELAVISLGRDRVLPVFRDCLNRGIRRLVVISQGFADADQRGGVLQEEMVELAHKHGARVVGPNTMGVVNAFSGFSSAFIDIPRELAPPPLTLVLQSGVFQAGYPSFTWRLGKSIDIGNGCDVDFVDLLEFLENDPQTQIIMLHMEGLKRGREFLKIAARVAPQKPILVLKTGRSLAGAQAALSHTGSLVGEDAIFDLAFAQAGLVRVRNLVELRAAAKAFLHFRPMAGPRLGMVTAAGAFGTMAADACADYGLELAPFPERIRGELEDPHIPWHHLRNPVDIWPLGMVAGSFSRVFAKAAEGLLRDEQVDAVLGVAPSWGSPLHADIDMMAAVRKIQGANPCQKPLALCPYGDDTWRASRALDQEPGVACFDTLDEAILGLAATWRWRRMAGGLQAEPGELAAQAGRPAPPALPSELPPYPRRQVVVGGLEADRKRAPGRRPPLSTSSSPILVGEESLTLLGRYGIPLVPGRLAQKEEEALDAAREFGFPVVLKIISPQWLHKSDLGGVRLHLGSEAAVSLAFQEMLALFAQRTPKAELQGVLVQKQVKGTELLFGIKLDPQFGPVLVAGMGGIYTEIFQDVARAFAPVNRRMAAAMLQSLRIYPILRGVRGQAGVALSGLEDIILSLSRLSLDYPEIEEMDLNPVVADAQGCWCVDCRVVVREKK
ncbi:MAG: acetate--CoA ligase family protein [Desulfobaccales bacterium]